MISFHPLFMLDGLVTLAVYGNAAWIISQVWRDPSFGLVSRLVWTGFFVAPCVPLTIMAVKFLEVLP